MTSGTGENSEYLKDTIFFYLQFFFIKRTQLVPDYCLKLVFNINLQRTYTVDCPMSHYVLCVHCGVPIYLRNVRVPVGVPLDGQL
jgi:hypothetical protein